MLVIVVSMPCVTEAVRENSHVCRSRGFPRVTRQEVDCARYECVRVQASVDEKRKCNVHDSAQANQKQKEVALALVSQIFSNQPSAGSVLVSVLLCHDSYIHGSFIGFFLMPANDF